MTTQPDLKDARSTPGSAPPWEWATATPESQGVSPGKLDALRDSLAARSGGQGTKAFLVIRNDRVVCEWYAPGHSATSTHYTASLAKALVGGVSVAVALGDGLLALDDRAAEYVPQWKEDPRKSAITIRHLGSHTSGLEDAEAEGLPHEKLTGWKGDFWKRRLPPDDPFSLSRDFSPVLFDPGAKLQYSNPGMAMLSYAVTAALRDAPRKDIRSLLRDRVMRPLGVPDDEWSVGYGQTFTVDDLPLVASWGGGSYTARAVARVARLLLRNGRWEGRQLLGEDTVRQVTADAGTPGHGGMGWWSNNEGGHDGLPRDAFWGAGAGHQVVLVVPSLDLIAVRNGESLGPASEFEDALNTCFFEPLMDAMERGENRETGRRRDGETGIWSPSPRLPVSPSPSSAPYPASSVIRAVTWAPPETIARQAYDCDNWPLTWADDDRLYTAYGDGYGFDPRVPEKLSLGFAKIVGGPSEFTGVNIRSATGEQKGQGEHGKKASGILMVDGVLYLWVRNASNSQLAWSSDHGRTWTWGDWKLTTSFGSPTFLSFGMNYAGARDDYVYSYSHDSDSAYEPADRMVLARVPREHIRSRDAYEFFQKLDTNGDPVWTKEIDQRGAVFTNPGRCYRTGVSYNAALKRYLWCQIIPGGAHPRCARVPGFRGGFGIYDAPEPWGPWTTLFYTEEWDVGPGETSSLPTKWMSADGRTVHLVFSGDDYFSVRKATLALAQDAAS